MVDSHQRTSISRLYAAGAIAKGLDQISHARGEVGVAATTIPRGACCFAGPMDMTYTRVRRKRLAGAMVEPHRAAQLTACVVDLVAI